jgi:hypothetical protein
MTQSCESYGHVTTYINDRALKIVIDGTSSYLVSAAPTWRVMFCNDNNKKAVSFSLTQWLKRIPQMTYAECDWDRYNLRLVRTDETRRFGRAMRRFVCEKSEIRLPIAPNGTAHGGNYIVLENSQAPLAACHIMEKALDCPAVSGVPVELVNHPAKGAVVAFSRSLGGDDHWFSTKSLEERAMPLSFFAYPTGYKIVVKEAEVVDDKKRQGQVKDIIEDLLPR